MIIRCLLAPAPGVQSTGPRASWARCRRRRGTGAQCTTRRRRPRPRGPGGRAWSVWSPAHPVCTRRLRRPCHPGIVTCRICFASYSPFRYATIRKSYTLPHNMAGAAGGNEARIYDNPNTMKQRQETQPIYAVTQGHQGSLPKKVSCKISFR